MCVCVCVQEIIISVLYDSWVHAFKRQTQLRPLKLQFTKVQCLGSTEPGNKVLIYALSCSITMQTFITFSHPIPIVFAHTVHLSPELIWAEDTGNRLWPRDKAAAALHRTRSYRVMNHWCNIDESFPIYFYFLLVWNLTRSVIFQLRLQVSCDS